jgi:hypothetical protein
MNGFLKTFTFGFLFLFLNFLSLELAKVLLRMLFFSKHLRVIESCDLKNISLDLSQTDV